MTKISPTKNFVKFKHGNDKESINIDVLAHQFLSFLSTVLFYPL